MTEHKTEAGSSQLRPPAPKEPLLALGDWDLHLFNEGRHQRLYEKLGAHATQVDGKPGTFFAVWAPNARQVSVIGDFNDWKPGKHPLSQRANSGIYEGAFAGLGKGQRYKFHITSALDGYQVAKTDPFGFFQELAPNTASIIWDLDYTWGDQAWMDNRGPKSAHKAPISIYEVHLRSWPTTCNAWASRTWSSCPSWSTRSIAPGATRSRATSRPPAATARRKI
jgi:1,4-alpha-glucan branching enzyme